MNEPQKKLFQRTAREMFADPSVYNTFVASVDGAKLRGFLKLTREERDKYDNNPDTWAKAYLEDHPGVFQPSLQATVRKWMSEFSSQYNLSEQSGIGKKDWNKVVNYAATAVAECLKEKSLVLNNITTNHYQYAMQEAFKIYYRRSLKGFVDPQFTNQIILNKILYLKRKKQEADELKKERGNMGEFGIRVMNRLAANTDDDADLYNQQVVPEIDQLIVPYDKYKYRDSPYINPKFVSSVEIKTLLKNKFQKNSKVKKTDLEIQDILTTTQNLINRTANPKLGLQSVANSSPNDSIFNDIVDNTSAQTQEEIEQAENENLHIDSLFDNNSGSSSGSSSNVLFNTPLKRKKIIEDEDEYEEDYSNALIGNFNNINNGPNGYNSNQSSIANLNANMNANLLNPLPNS
jgi:hypothetical protein